MPSEPVLTREELKDHLETIEGHVRQMTEEATQTLEEMREDRASFREEVGEELQKIQRDITQTLWISFGSLSLVITLVTFLSLHLFG